MVNWTVKTDTTNVSLTAEQLVKMLSDKILTVDKPDLTELTATLSSYLQANEVLHTMRMVDTLHVGIAIGYFYRVFLEKNDVKMEFANDSTGSPSNNTTTPGSPSGPSGSSDKSSN